MTAPRDEVIWLRIARRQDEISCAVNVKHGTFHVKLCPPGQDLPQRPTKHGWVRLAKLIGQTRQVRSHSPHASQGERSREQLQETHGQQADEGTKASRGAYPARQVRWLPDAPDQDHGSRLEILSEMQSDDATERSAADDRLIEGTYFGGDALAVGVQGFVGEWDWPIRNDQLRKCKFLRCEDAGIRSEPGTQYQRYRRAFRHEP